MRRVILLLLVALLPLNGWAAASVRCLHETAGGTHPAWNGEAGQGDHVSDVHHGEHAAHAGAVGDGDCAHADCGCCHAAGTAAFGFARLPVIGPAFGHAPVAVADASPDSPSLAGPFRPPRAAAA